MCFYLLKRKVGPEPATNFKFFNVLLKNHSIVVGFSASRSRYVDALVLTKRGHPTARRLERRRRASARETDPSGAARIAPAGAPLHEPGTRRPYAANHRPPRRSLPTTGRS